MSFDTATKQQFCFELESERGSQDSGIGIDTDDIDENNVFRFWHSSNSKNMFSELNECIDEMMEGEVGETVGSNPLVASRYQHKAHGFTSARNSSESLKDVTNRICDDESPKTHFVKRTRLLDFNFTVNKCSKVCLDSDQQITRKRSLDFTPMMQKKRKDVKSPMKKLGKKKDQQSSMYSFLRVQSSSSISTLDLSKSSENSKLPQFLHVDYSLETVTKPQIESVAFKSISGKVVADLMSSMSAEEFSKKYILVDCRYPYEYNGGHLRGAINIYDTARILEVFFPTSDDLFRETSSKIPIFYCEYSQKRGPTMANALRQADRKKNEDRYPEVDYKEIYLLDRGYKKFFEEDRFVHLCEPQSYTKMIATPHKEDLKRYQLHKSRSVSCFCYSTVEAQRGLHRVRSRFSSLIDEEMDVENSCTALPNSPSSPSDHKPCRGNMFGPSFRPMGVRMPGAIKLKPPQFDSFS